MVILGIFLLMTMVALPRAKISSTLLIRVTSILLLFVARLSYQNRYINSMGSGLSLFNGLFDVTSITGSFDRFMAIVGSIILIGWAPRGFKN